MVGAAAQDATDAAQRVPGAAPVPDLGLLHPAADVVDDGQREAHDVKRVQHWSNTSTSAGTHPWPDFRR
jgi:hypothetical protein